MTRLTRSKLITITEQLLKRDGEICLYCEQKLDPLNCIIEHLDDDDRHNNIENFVLSHHACNDKKKFSQQYKQKALLKLEENQTAVKHVILKRDFERARNRLEDKSPSNASTEIEINLKNREIVEQYLTEKIAAEGSVDFTDALNSATYLCVKKTCHGAQQTIRNYFDLFTSEIGPFMIIRDEMTHKKRIKKREDLR